MTVPTNFGPGLLVLNNTPFLIPNTPGNNLDGGPVIGTYKLTIRDTKSNNTGTLTSWSVAVNSYLPVLGVQFGASMDQNANAISDENPMTLANGYTGLTPGDVYAVPMPQLTAPVTFTTAQSILSPPFNQNTLPLIVPGPQIASTLAVGTSGQQSTGSTDLLTNDTTSQFQVTFDRPVQTEHLHRQPGLGDHGPVGLDLGPQIFNSTGVDQAIPAATIAGPGTLSSTVTVNSGGTLQIQTSASRSASPPRRTPGSPRS